MKLTHKDLLDAGVHFGHLKKKWNPKMAPYIFMERKGIHVIDLNRTLDSLETATKAMYEMAKSGRKVLFVSTKKQSRQIIKDAAESVGMPFVTDRWLGGMMTNFPTIRRSIKKMKSLERMLADGTLENVTKKERLTLTRELNKLQKVLGGIANLNRVPAAMFIVDTVHEHIAVKEAKKLGVRTFGIVDTNADPREIDFPIPGNDDSSRSVSILASAMVDAIRRGLEERQNEKAAEKKAAPAEEAPKAVETPAEEAPAKEEETK